jgi:hypothetical protein
MVQLLKVHVTLEMAEGYITKLGLDEAKPNYWLRICEPWSYDGYD